LKENYFVKNKLKKIAISQYLQKELSGAGFVNCEVNKTPLSTRITIYALKPGYVIGKKGANIRELTAKLEEKFELSKIHIEIGEVSNQNLDPKVVIENISSDIARGVSWKSTVYRALRQIKQAGAVGAEIVATGNTAGKGQRKRKSRYYFGYLKKAGDQKNLVGFEKRTTFPGLGTIGIRLRIVQPDTIFSDKIDVLEYSKKFKIKREEEILEKETLKEKKKVEEKEAKEKAPVKTTKEDSKETKEEKTVKKKTVAKKLVNKDAAEEIKEEKTVKKKTVAKKLVNKAVSETKEAKESKDAKESKEVKESKDAKENKEEDK
jgi:small subunit ribosomal protein S3